MNKDTISARKMVALLVTFMLGNTIITGGSTALDQDSWISVIAGALMAIPMVIIYARIVKLYPGKNVYEICTELFGKILGWVINLLITWYALHLGALVLRNFSEFIQITSKPETPQIIVMLSIIVVVFYLVRSGMKTIGRWSIIVLLIISLVVITTLALGGTSNRMESLLPFFNHSPREIFNDAFILFSFPYAEVVLFLAVFDSLKKGESPYKVFLYGVGLTAVILLLVAVRNITLLGQEMIRISLFPSYVATRIISVGRFLTKIEGIVMINFILLGVTKITVALLAASKGVASLFNLKNYKSITIPLSLTIVVMGMIIYRNVIEMFDFVNSGLYSIYAIPFQIIIPILIWITAEVKNKNKKSKQKSNSILIRNDKVYYVQSAV